MQKVILFIVSCLLLFSQVKAQTFASANNNSGTPPQYYSLTSHTDDGTKLRLCNETKAGFVITGLGIITGGIGIVTYNSNKGERHEDIRYRNAKIGEGLWLVGGVVAIMGSVLSIDGGVRDLHRYYKVRRIIIISEGKSVGFAYNF